MPELFDVNDLHLAMRQQRREYRKAARDMKRHDLAEKVREAVRVLRTEAWQEGFWQQALHDRDISSSEEYRPKYEARVAAAKAKQDAAQRELLVLLGLESY